MFRYELVAQSPDRKRTIGAAVQSLAAECDYDRLRGYFAYATEAGVAELLEYLTKGWRGDWERTRKRWLISADFGFTEPGALRVLKHLKNSEVRIPDASYLLEKHLNPRITHHAKVLILDQRGPGGGAPLGLLVGSANLTVSALGGNFEGATLAVWKDPLAKRDQASLTSARQAIKDFDRAWRKAEKLDSSMLAEYEAMRKRVKKAPRWPDQERKPLLQEARRENAGSFELAAALRSADKFWIQTGNMYKNLGESGNQIDMQAGSRVFFGFSNRKVPPNHLLGEVRLGYWGHSVSARHVRYGDNSMDKIYLPNPGTEGTPASYANETLLFERKRDGSFRFKLAGAGEAEEWKRKSKSQDTAFKMRSGREFGVFT